MAAVLGVISGAVLVRVGEGLTDLSRGSLKLGNGALRSANHAPNDAGAGILLVGSIYAGFIALMLAAAAVATSSIGAGLLTTCVVILIGQPTYATIAGVFFGVLVAVRCLSKLTTPLNPAN